MNCSVCAKPFPKRRRNPKTTLCRHCWSIKALNLRKRVLALAKDERGFLVMPC